VPASSSPMILRLLFSIIPLVITMMARHRMISSERDVERRGTISKRNSPWVVAIVEDCKMEKWPLFSGGCVCGRGCTGAYWEGRSQRRVLGGVGRLRPPSRLAHPTPR
jgi:hypothetical protein